MQKGLIETIQTEKKRRRRGKRLNLVSEEDSSAQLFPTAKVRDTLVYTAAKEALATAEKAKKAAKKAQAAENKQRKEVDTQEKAVQRQVERELKAQVKANEIAAKRLEKHN